jgi:energy-coupling factor transporter ATP-binding protein EcfA2
MAEESTITFRRLRLAQWRQFASIDIEFHPQLTVLTGANGVGKSTLLNIIARHLGAERPYLSTPSDYAEGQLRYLTGVIKSALWKTFGWTPEARNQVGDVTYSDGAVATLSVPDTVRGHEYSLEVNNQQPINGIAFSSHRTLPAYHQIPHISFRGVDPDQAFGIFVDELRQRYRGHYYSPDNSLLFRIKNTLAAWAAVGEGNSVLQPNPRQKAAYDGFIEILRRVLPESLGFLTLAVRPPEVVMITKSGEFLIDAVSGGVSTLIENAALIYSCSIQSRMVERGFVVAFDEPENHLHPELQRDLFVKLTTAFPQVQFIVATHSPFIVSSLKQSHVYALRYRTLPTHAPSESSRVVSEKLDYANRAGTASEILREVLGVPSTLPKWVEDDLATLLRKYQTVPITEASLAHLRNDLRAAGLSDFFPEALVGLSRDR